MNDSNDPTPDAPGDIQAEIYTRGLRSSPGAAQPPKRDVHGPRAGSNRARWTGIAALIAAGGIALWFWNGSNRVVQYMATPGEGHVHTASVLPLPGSADPALWLGTHDGLFLKELVSGAPAGWRRAGPPLNSTDVMAVSGANVAGSPVYAAGHKIGVQRSDDGGATWRQVMVGAPARDVHALAVDPRDPERIYIWAEVAGLFTSPNGGATWETVDEGKALKSPVQVTALAVSRTSEALAPVLYAGTNLGLFVSPDGGSSWAPVRGEAIEQPVYSLLFLNGTGRQEAYAGSVSGAIYSPDGLTGWKRLKGTAELGGVGGLAVVDSPGPRDRLLLVNSASQVFSSDDRGATWTPLP